MPSIHVAVGRAVVGDAAVAEGSIAWQLESEANTSDSLIKVSLSSLLLLLAAPHHQRHLAQSVGLLDALYGISQHSRSLCLGCFFLLFFQFLQGLPPSAGLRRFLLASAS